MGVGESQIRGSGQSAVLLSLKAFTQMKRESDRAQEGSLSRSDRACDERLGRVASRANVAWP